MEFTLLFLFKEYANICPIKCYFQNLATYNLISSHGTKLSETRLPYSLLPSAYIYENHNFSTDRHSNQSLASLPRVCVSSSSKSSPSSRHQFSTLPTHMHTLGLPVLTNPSSSMTRSNFQIYNQLQLPSASNNGSMKRKKKTSDESTFSSDMSRFSQSDYSSSRPAPPSDKEEELYEQDDEVWKLHYVPKVFTISNNTVHV